MPKKRVTHTESSTAAQRRHQRILSNQPTGNSGRTTTSSSSTTAVMPLPEFNPVLANSVSYIGTATMFLIAYLVPGLPTLPYPLTGCLIPDKKTDFADWKNGQYVLLALYCFHFVRRILEVLFVHKYKRTMPLSETIGGPIYYWFFAFWTGWAIRHDSGYSNTYLPMFIIGSIMFVVGEVGNCATHFQLRYIRSEKYKQEHTTSESGHVIPSGPLFALVSCPHYTFEIVTWLGFMMASWALPALLFVVATTTTLLIYSRKHHLRYKAEFDGQDGRELYPTNRKALIPFIF